MGISVIGLSRCHTTIEKIGNEGRQRWPEKMVSVFCAAVTLRACACTAGLSTGQVEDQAVLIGATVALMKKLCSSKWGMRCILQYFQTASSSSAVWTTTNACLEKLKPRTTKFNNEHLYTAIKSFRFIHAPTAPSARKQWVLILVGFVVYR